MKMTEVQANLQQLDGNQMDDQFSKMVPMSDVEWDAGILLLLWQKFYSTVEALL